MGWRERFGALGERNFRLLWIGQTTSVLGDALVAVALSFAVLELTGSASDLGLVLMAETLPLIGFVLVGGVWADRLPRQLVMLSSDCVRCVSQSTVAVLLLTGNAELWHLIVLEAVYGSAAAFFEPAATGLVPATVSPHRLQEANALFGVSRSAGFIAGPALAGVIVAVANPGIAFAIDAGSFLASIASLALLRVPRVVRGERKTFAADLAAGWHELVSRTWLWVIIVWAATYLLVVYAPFHVLGPLVARESLGGSKAWGFITAAYSAGALFGGLLALRWKHTRPMFACVVLTFVEAVPPSLVALREPTGAIAAAQVAAGVVMGFFLAVWTTTLQQEIPERSLSRVSSYDWLGSLAFLPLGFVLAGPVAAAIGVSTTLWISSAWVVISTAAVLLVPGIWALRRREAGTVGLQPEGKAA